MGYITGRIHGRKGWGSRRLSRSESEELDRRLTKQAEEALESTQDKQKRLKDEKRFYGELEASRLKKLEREEG